MQAVFDGHNDVLLRLWQRERGGSDPVAEFIDGTDKGHIDAPRAREGGLIGGLCAIYIPSGDLVLRVPDTNGHYATPLSAPLDHLPSLATALEIADIAFRLDRAGAWRLCRSTDAIRRAIDDGVFAAVLHMEGCEAIGPDLAGLETFHAAGLRSLGPVWSRHNVFGHGVPFAYPMSPDSGGGLTEAGFELVRACNRLGILVDLAHLTEKGFWDVAKTTDQPLVASHSNAHALTPVARNLTDRQLDAIGESQGLVGLNYATTMLRADGQENAATPLADMVRHVDYMVERLGIDCIALGSDFDGATIPEAIGDAAGNQRLVAALREAGYGDRELKKICGENWLRVLAKAWHEDA
ncbi:dipeptidase [Sinorhizobium alkalisoli]|uniref:Peptidase n=1 Tax=Sinorhizobium alkalisoli TaxID=1752398 RepID=A0A1E3VDI3_9HYPH|nr:dipeptidase [Sinorhizobium alkalisoli]MCA1494317.1 dipeptidase [Ensifer sp. NBAIM29]ODR91640.1 peptidase [Sinorhizobium alkalisoli]QFI67343.1 Microsomal dipeptidase [Sinorhizobium alkalisoli]